MNLVTPSSTGRIPYVYYPQTSRIKVKRIPNDGRSKHDKNEAFAKMFSEFLEHTSVPGLAQVGSRKNVVWKYSWILMTLVGLAMAVYQSRSVITDYYQNSVVQRISYSTPSFLSLPSVTICSNVFVDEKTLLHMSRENKGLMKFMQWNEGEYERDESIPKFQSPSRYIAGYELQHRWNESIRLQLCGPLAKRLEYIALRPDKRFSFIANTRAEMLEVIHQFHNYAFGCCFTVNPGFENRSELLNGVGKELLIQLNMDIRNRKLHPNDFFASVLIHPLSTPPLMGSPDLIEVYPGDYVKIIVKLSELVRKTEASGCVSNGDHEWRKKLALYNEYTPYIYTKLACEETCAQYQVQWNLRPETSCLRAESPVTEELIGKDLKPSFCSNIMATDLLSSADYFCNCPLACKEDILKKSVISTSGFNWNAYRNMIRLNNTGIQGAEHTLSLDKYNSSMIRVMYESTQVETITEENKYSVADFWGIIGGNLGLWVGLCLLSCVEVVEFFSSIVSALCKCRRG